MPASAAMTAFLVIVAAVYGLIIGSFLNVCIYRLPRDQSIVWPAYKVANGVACTVTATNSAIDFFTWQYDGTTLFCFVSGQAMATP